jgi:hypothetical protein
MHLQAKEMKCGKVMQKQLYCKTQLTKNKVQSNKRQFHMGKKQSGQKKKGMENEKSCMEEVKTNTNIVVKPQAR